LIETTDMKKVLKIIAITGGVILLFLLLTPLLFKSKIETVVKEKVNEQVHAQVDWSRLSLSFFRGFPDLSVNLHQLSVVGLDLFAGDTLAGIQRFEIRVNPFSAIGKNLQVKAILVDNPLLNGIVLGAGMANWDIAVEKELTEEDSITVQEAGKSAMRVSLRRLVITNGRIYYVDKISGLDASLEGFSLELQGDLSMEETELTLSSKAERINAKMGGIRYLKDAVLDLELTAAANMVENRYTLKENLLSLNGLTLDTEGEIIMLDEGAMEMDLKISSLETSFKTLLSVVPAIYLREFESLETRGNLQLDAHVDGTLNESVLPDVDLNLQVKDGYFAYPDLPGDVSDVQISLQVDFKGEDEDASVVDLEKFHFLLGGNPFDLNMQVDHPLSDMHVAGRAEGIIDFATLKDVIPIEDVDLEGRLETHLVWDAFMSQFEQEQYEHVSLDGLLLVENVHLDAPDIPVPLTLEKVSMLFNPSYVELSSFDMKLGSSDMHVSGDLKNFLPYVFDNQVVSGRLAFSSNLLDANEILPQSNGSDEELVSDSIIPVGPDSLAQPIGIRIPENVDFTLSVDVNRIEYKKLVLENMEGAMQVIDGVAGIEQLKMDVVEGNITSRGYVDTRGAFAEVDINLEMKGMDIPSAYASLVSVKKLMPMARYCRGKANIKMKYHSLMDNTFTPLYESIEAKGDAHTNGLQFYNLEEFVPLSKLLQNEKFSEMTPDEVDVGFTVREGRIIFNPFDWEIDQSTFMVSGSHGIDLSMDYRLDMNIAKVDLGSGANELMQGLTLLAAGAGINIPQSDYIKVIGKLGGTFNSPKFTTDLSENLRSSGEQVQAAVEEQVREAASKQAEKLIAGAEAEASRLVEEARKAGEALVREAELQGEKLMEEAGSNPLKQIAARTAANELTHQAESQSANLIKEAEKQGEALVLKAREEAGKL
jgi:hypothetical protein